MASSSPDAAPVPAPPQTQELLQTLRPHHSRLPGGLYLLSFCPPLPSPFAAPRAFVQHPGVLYASGFISAVIAGMGILSLDILYGAVWTAGITGDGVTPEQIRSVSTRTAWIMAIVSGIYFLFCWLFLACFTAASAALTQRLRHAYIASVLSQDAAYHDRHGAGEVATHAGKECGSIRVALGEKLAFVVWSLSTLVASVTVGFIKNSRVAGTLFALIPFCIILFTILAILTERIGGPMLRLEGRASSFLEECLGGVRVTQAFGMREHLVERFDHAMLKPLARLGMKRAAIRGGENGTFYLTLMLSYATAFFAIARFRGETGPSLTAFWNFLNSLFCLANVVPMLSSLIDATTATNHLRRTIERVPLIDVRDPRGLRLQLEQPPSIELKNVVMAYPSRPNVPSLDGVSVTFESGKVTALVGQSGSGKSTITELLMRAYDPLTANLRQASDEADDAADRAAMGEKPKDDEQKPRKKLFGARTKSISSAEDPEKDGEKTKPINEVPQVRGAGEVYLDGHDLRELNLSWLRSQIAIVRQMPQITTASIFENVAAGLTGTELEYRPQEGGVEAMDAIEKLRYEQIRERVSAALVKAQAFDFVSRLPAGMDTQVSGGKTGLLSGGQRQRIAIARALIREPKLLILDEGTSALDSQSEALIRDMLQEEQRRRGMTTILIAHRLSTIAHADQIVVMRNGRIIDRASTTDEASAHTQLMDPKRDNDVNLYRAMVLTQRHIATAENDSPVKTGLTDETDNETSSLELLDSDGVTTRVAAQSTRAPSQPSPSSLQQRPVALKHRTSRASDHPPVQLAGRGATTMAHVEKVGEEDAKGVASKEERAELKRQSKRERRRLLVHFGRLLRRYWFLFLVGLIGAILVGAAFPVAGWLTGGGVNALTIDRITDNDRRVRESNRYALYFFILAMASLVLVTINSCALEFASERLLRRLKRQSFAAVLLQEIGWFDAPENHAGSLTASVSSSPASVAAATGLTSSQLIVSCTNLTGGVILAFILSWKAAVVCLAPLLVLFISSSANVVMLERYESKVSVPAGKAASYVAENVDAMKEIAALGREPEVMRRFDEQARTEPKRTVWLIVGAGGFAISQMAVLAISALIFYWCGARLYADGDLSQTSLFALFEAVVISVFSAGRVLQFTPDIGRAAASFRKIVGWSERKPRVAQLPPTDQPFTGVGDIVFTDVELRYPQRPDHPALTGLDLVIKSGQTHAFVGPSGAGKSTILQMCARFYDPARGTLCVGGVDVRTVPVEVFREKIGLVSQDPVLISGSIGWNISLGSPDPASVTRAQLEEACEQACILDFIRSLPQGFDTDVGGKGAQLSGGQKQRICIARALIRDPKILLLDEATSALDAEAEVSVQQALARASTGRTCVTIAHRLSTVRKAHCIHVVEDGHIIESGTHDELLARRGRYLELIEAQL